MRGDLAASGVEWGGGGGKEEEREEGVESKENKK